MNSRLVHDYHIIDGLPQTFKLVVGVGNDVLIGLRHTTKTKTIRRLIKRLNDLGYAVPLETRTA